jgi:acetoin utilization protein AcuC
MNGVSLPAKLPDKFVTAISALGYPHRMLVDAMHWAEEGERNLALDAVEKSIRAIRRNIFPVIIGGRQ